MCSVKITVAVVVAQWVLLSVAAQYPPNTGIFNGLLNSFQLGVKNFFDQFVPNIQFPRPVNTPDVQVGEIILPAIFGSGRIKLTNCPNCYNLDPGKLTGVWHLLAYVICRFLLYRESNTFNKIIVNFVNDPAADGYNSITFPSNQPNPIPGPPPQPGLFQPVRFPVCVRLEIFEPIDTGFGEDFPVEISFLESRPNGKLKSVQGVFRQVNQGSYLMSFNNGAYYIRFCPVESSILDLTPYEPPPPVEPGEPPGVPVPVPVPTELPLTELNPPINASVNQTETILNDALTQDPTDGSNYLILSDTSTFPGCNNYAVFTTDTDYYYRNYDEQVMKLIARERADSDANPLHFLGCPCGLRE